MAKRGRGRPETPLIGPQQLAEIGRLLLRRVPVRDVAKKYGVHPDTIRDHVARHLKPIWLEQSRIDQAEELSRIAELERVAWECFESDAPAETVKQVTEQLAKNLGGKGKAKAADLLVVVEQHTRTKFASHQTAYLHIVQWCIEQRILMAGLRKPSELNVNLDGEFRIAGKTPAEVDQEMLEDLARRLQDRRDYEAALAKTEHFDES